MLQKRVNLFGVRIDDIDMKRALLFACKSLRGGERRCFFTINPEMLARAVDEERIKRLLNSSSVSLPDGFGLKLVGKILGNEVKHTTPGIDFGEGLISVASKTRARVFFLGGKRGVAHRAARNMLIKYPGLIPCGAFHGYFKKEHTSAVIKMIEKSGADIVIVCLGFPRQEGFALKLMEQTQAIKVVACLGGSFDVWSGEVERASECLRRLHLEWLYRVARQPSRVFRLVKSFDAVLYAGKSRLEKMIACGINEVKRAYNQTDIL